MQILSSGENMQKEVKTKVKNAKVKKEDFKMWKEPKKRQKDKVAVREKSDMGGICAVSRSFIWFFGGKCLYQPCNCLPSPSLTQCTQWDGATGKIRESKSSVAGNCIYTASN